MSGCDQNVIDAFRLREINARSDRRTITKLMEQSFLKNNSCFDFQLGPTVLSTIAIAMSPDGETICTTHGDHTVKVFKYPSGKIHRIFEGHPRTPWTVKYHPNDSDLIASGCLGCEVRVWKISANQLLRSIRFEFSIISLAFQPHSTPIVVASGPHLYLWHWSDEKSYRTSKRIVQHTRNIRAVMFHPSGEIVYAAAPDPPRQSNVSFTPCRLYSIKCADVFNSEAVDPPQLLTLPAIVPQVHLYSDGGLDISADGTHLLTCAMLFVPPDPIPARQAAYTSTEPYQYPYPSAHTHRGSTTAAPGTVFGGGGFASWSERNTAALLRRSGITLVDKPQSYPVYAPTHVHTYYPPAPPRPEDAMLVSPPYKDSESLTERQTDGDAEQEIVSGHVNISGSDPLMSDYAATRFDTFLEPGSLWVTGGRTEAVVEGRDTEQGGNHAAGNDNAVGPDEDGARTLGAAPPLDVGDCGAMAMEVTPPPPPQPAEIVAQFGDDNSRMSTVSTSSVNMDASNAPAAPLSVPLTAPPSTTSFSFSSLYETAASTLKEVATFGLTLNASPSSLTPTAGGARVVESQSSALVAVMGESNSNPGLMTPLNDPNLDSSAGSASASNAAVGGRRERLWLANDPEDEMAVNRDSVPRREAHWFGDSAFPLGEHTPHLRRQSLSLSSDDSPAASSAETDWTNVPNPLFATSLFDERVPPGWQMAEHLCLFRIYSEEEVRIRVADGSIDADTSPSNPGISLLRARRLTSQLMKAITSAKLSSSGSYGLVGYGVRSNGYVEDHSHSMVAAEVVSLDSPDLRTVLMIQDEVDEVNIAQFHPVPGNGLIYGTKRGKVRMSIRSELCEN